MEHLSLRERIAMTIATRDPLEDWCGNPISWADISEGHRECYRRDADAILATPGIAVVELPAKITTADELDALPFLTVIREIRPRRGIDYGGIYERRTSGWQCIAGTWVEPERNGGPTLPVMVLWRGKDER